MSLSAAEWERYARQIGPGVLSREGQERLKRSTVLVTRVGGMGGPAAQGLVMAGVGRVIIAHGGAMISADLNRQVLGSEGGIGRLRAEHFAARLRELNRFVAVESIDHEPDDAEADALAERCDLLIASPPNFAERLRLNHAAVRAGKPLVDAAQWGLGGTLIVVRPGETACLTCVYPDEPPFEEFFPVVGAISSTIGSLAALEAIKILSGTGEPLFGKMFVYDGLRGIPSVVALRRNAGCPVCSPSESNR